MRRFAGWAAVVVGLLVVILGAGISVAFGPDDTLTSDPQRLTATGAVIATTPDAIAISGPTVTITVEAVDPKTSVFLGVGRNLEVADYLGGVPRLEVDDVSWPWDFSSDDVGGKRSLPADPADLDWWLTSDADEHAATVSLPLPDDDVDIVAVDPAGRDGFEADVTVGFVVHGAFFGGFAIALLGLGIAGLGWLARARRDEDAG